jgi:hypothetical protein
MQKRFGIQKITLSAELSTPKYEEIADKEEVFVKELNANTNNKIKEEVIIKELNADTNNKIKEEVFVKDLNADTNNKIKEEVFQKN